MQISEQFYQANQSWNYELTSRIPSGHKLRVEIRRNAYDEQSYVHGLVFDTIHNKWNVIVTRPIGSACCASADYVRNNQEIPVVFSVYGHYENYIKVGVRWIADFASLEEARRFVTELNGELEPEELTSGAQGMDG